jgi:hypothetical protein
MEVIIRIKGFIDGCVEQLQSFIISEIAVARLGGKFAIVFRHRSNLSVRLFCPNTSALTFH